MSLHLVILTLAAFAMVAFAVSAGVALCMPIFDRIAQAVAPRHRARLWLGLAVGPAMVALLAAGASFLPALGIGHDHCLVHGPHHPHLCPHHVGAAPGIVLVLIAGALVIQLGRALAAFAIAVRASVHASRALREASELRDGLRIFPSDEPQAFVLGVLRPRVHVSRGLLALGRDLVEPVLAHEKIHADRRDLLWRALFAVLALGHWPSVAQALSARLVAAQESAADDEAARLMEGGRLKLAEAIVLLLSAGLRPAAGVSIVHGRLEARVRALLEDEPVRPAWRARALVVAALIIPITVVLLHDPIHHGLETLLGALS